MFSLGCCRKPKENSDPNIITLTTFKDPTDSSPEDQIPGTLSNSNNTAKASHTKQPLKRSLSDSPSATSVSSFRSAKSTYSVADDFYSVCSEDSFKSVAPNKQGLQ